jgi:hypothetical protein
MKNAIWMFFMVLWLFPGNGYSQDLIFKKSGEVLKVVNLSTSGRSRSYQLQGDDPGIFRHISVNIIDSIVYENGTRDVMAHSVPVRMYSDTEEIRPFRRNLLVMDISALLFYQNFQLSFEHLPGKGHLGYFVTLSLNSNPVELVKNIDQSYSYDNTEYTATLRFLKTSFRAGANAYLFPPGFFRLSAGLSYIRGNYDLERTEYFNQEPFMLVKKEKNLKMNGILFSPALNVQPVDNLHFRMGIDYVLVSNTGFKQGMFRLEMAYNL